MVIGVRLLVTSKSDDEARDLLSTNNGTSSTSMSCLAGVTHSATMLNNFLTPEGARLVQKYLGRTWGAFILTAAIGGSIGTV